jgi:uncharacterized RDD family membrane protein YckC
MAGGRAKAGFGARFGAWFIDGLIVSAFSVPAFIALLNGEKELYQCSSDLDETSSGAFICERPTSGTYSIFFVLLALAVVGAIVYFGLMEGKGKTVGKRVAGISVVDQNTGQPIGTGRAIGRYFARMLSSIPCALGYFWMLWDPNSQTWHDKMTSSVVVQD